MDFQLNASLNASVSARQIANQRGEGPSVSPRPGNGDAGPANHAGQADQVNQLNQANQVSFTSSLLSAANTLDAHKVKEAKLDNQARGYIREVELIQSGENDAAEDAHAEDKSRAHSEDGIKQATDAYLAAGAAFNTNATDSDPVVFSPEEISPIDIQA